MIDTLRGPRRALGGAPELSSVERLERFLGDPWDPGQKVRYARGPVAAPLADACAHLDAWGLHRYYVPVEHGGELTSLQELFDLVRTVARRDPAAAVTHARTLLGAAGVWVAGDRDQARHLGSLVTAGETVVLGGPERQHIGDLLTGEVTARRNRRGYRLDGERWLLDNAAGGRLMCLLARTVPHGGPRGFSLLLVDQRDLDPATFRHLPEVPAVGLRGAGTSGVAFHRAVVDRAARIGAEGQGVEVLLKVLQVVRTISPAVCLGTADRALRLAVRMASEREAYGSSPYGHPLTRRVLGEAYADLLAMEALGAVAARSAHLAPGELSVTSAAVRSLLPAVVDGVLARLRELFTPRSLPFGTRLTCPFDQMGRDHRVVTALDGATAGCHALVSQFRALARHHAQACERQVPAGVFDLGAPLPPVPWAELNLVARNGSGLLGTLPESAQVLRRAAQTAPELAAPARLAARFAAAVDSLPDTLPRTPRTAAGLTPKDEDAAHRYALLLAAAACLGVWCHAGEVNRAWPDGLWLHAVLCRLYARLKPGDRPFLAVASPWGSGRDEELFERMSQRLALQCQAGEALSLLPSRTAESDPC
ncbi:hypothetical protein AQ490_05200 [Wenjunlia vitaminophila]|uniref:Acyl-CoA dehydrogenase/oxidase C-terminal domain-containing protein n=1 Tax=Wenjunlia vitaminophila TaxID=76728 RepID=A0A0T6LPN1_WENVI|nr:acyl-CoA dehydrogenase [Wenjunlia vitaminophila]KRV47772.1 hypothetical protein AQ490_05200 [Wenjunlia vitaminophila]